MRGLLQQHDELKKAEAEFKESCRKDLAMLQQQIEWVQAEYPKDATTILMYLFQTVAN